MLYDIFTHVSSSFFKCPQEKPGGAVAGKKTILQRTLMQKKNSWLGSKNNFFAADADTSKIPGLGKKDVQRPMIRTGIF